jgi:hypothetical protein
MTAQRPHWLAGRAWRVLHMGETDCVAGHIGFELRCAERKFISLTSRAVSDSGDMAQTLAVSAENDLLCRAGPFPDRRGPLADIASGAPSGRPAAIQNNRMNALRNGKVRGDAFRFSSNLHLRHSKPRPSEV